MSTENRTEQLWDEFMGFKMTHSTGFAPAELVKNLEGWQTVARDLTAESDERLAGVELASQTLLNIGSVLSNQRITNSGALEIATASVQAIAIAVKRS